MSKFEFRNFTPLRSSYVASSKILTPQKSLAASKQLMKCGSMSNINIRNQSGQEERSLIQNRLKQYKLVNNDSGQKGSLRVIKVYQSSSVPQFKPEFRELVHHGITVKTFETEEEINQDIKNIAKSLLQMAKCVKESITHLKSEELGRAKFSLISKEWEFAEMDYSKHRKSLIDSHGVDMLDGDKLTEYKANHDSSQAKKMLKIANSKVEKLLGYADPFAGITEAFVCPAPSN